MNASMKALFIVKTWIVIHFGIKPKNGGRPPNDMKFKMKSIFIVKFEFIEVNNCFRYEILSLLKITTMLIVIIE